MPMRGFLRSPGSTGFEKSRCIFCELVYNRGNIDAMTKRVAFAFSLQRKTVTG